MVCLGKLQKWDAKSVERGLEWGDTVMARLARIGLNLLICVFVLSVVAGGVSGLVLGKWPTPAMFGVTIDLAPSSSPEPPRKDCPWQRSESVLRGPRIGVADS